MLWRVAIDCHPSWFDQAHWLRHTLTKFSSRTLIPPMEISPPWKTEGGPLNRRIKRYSFCSDWILATACRCPKFFLLETAILSQKKIYFSPNFRHTHKKLSRGPMLDCIWEFFVRKQKLDKGHLRVWATIKTHSVAAAHSRVAFCF